MPLIATPFPKIRAGRSQSGHILPVAGIFCIVVLAATVTMVWQQRRSAIYDAGLNLENVSRALADQTDRVMTSLSRAEDYLAASPDLLGSETGTLGSEAAAFSVYNKLRAVVASTAESYGFAVTDASGRLLLTSSTWPTPDINVSDREYFTFAMHHPEQSSFVAAPLSSRTTGKQVFNVVRRLPGRTGTPSGLLLGSVSVGYFEGLFAENTLHAGATIALITTDGTLLVRYPHIPFEPDTARDARFRDMLAEVGRGPFRHAAIIAGPERLLVASRVPHQPLVIIVSEPFASATGVWRAQSTWTVFAALLGLTATMITAYLAVRRIADQKKLEQAIVALAEDRERARAAMVRTEENAWFGLAMENMTQAVLLFDGENRLKLFNPATNLIFRLGDKTLSAGMPLEQVVLAISNALQINDRVPLLALYHRLIANNISTAFSRDLPDGRYLAGNFAPHPLGWLVTFEDTTELRRAGERIEHMALHDALTGLPNRVLFRTRTEATLRTLGATEKFALLYIDLDDFKAVNDTLGHPAGDRLLNDVAQRLSQTIRPGDVLARLGGDEFAILLLDRKADGRTVRQIATDLVKVISQPFSDNGQALSVGVSIGIAMAPEHGDDPDVLLKHADLALYQAKRNGRGRHEVFVPSMWHEALDRRRIGAEMRHALVAGEFELFYQPIVQVRTRRIAGFESLIRWRHPRRGLIPPLEFVPIAEENGFIVEMGAWVLETACVTAAGWPDYLKVAVNLSPVQFRCGTLAQTVADALALSGLPPHRLELEITESGMMEDTDAALTTLARMKDLGVRIAMDDFGTGYSSLAYLHKFPFDKVKIDRSFIRNIADQTNLSIVRAVSGIARSMRIDTTAEGVETEEQFTRIADEGCTEAQGFLFGLPCPNEFVLDMLDGHHLHQLTHAGRSDQPASAV